MMTQGRVIHMPYNSLLPLWLVTEAKNHDKGLYQNAPSGPQIRMKQIVIWDPYNVWFRPLKPVISTPQTRDFDPSNPWFRPLEFNIEFNGLNWFNGVILMFLMFLMFLYA
jgi:hypothetical protein